MMPTGAITQAVIDRAPAPPTMTEEDAVAAILAGHRAAAYSLPAPLLNAAEGAAAVVARAAALHKGLSEADTALGEGRGRLVAEIVRQAATTGAIPKLDTGAEMVKLEAAVTRIRHEDAVYQVAAAKVETYPGIIAKSISGEVHSALDAGLRELLTAARPHAAKVAAVDPDAGDPLVAAFRADPAGYDALEALTGRLAALEAARDALARLQRPWEALPADDGTPDILRLARMAVGG
jgi:hypothetical protein